MNDTNIQKLEETIKEMVAEQLVKTTKGDGRIAWTPKGRAEWQSGTEDDGIQILCDALCRAANLNSGEMRRLLCLIPLGPQ